MTVGARMQGAAETGHSVQAGGRNREQYDAGLLGIVADVWLILMRAHAAAQLYAELSRQMRCNAGREGSQARRPDTGCLRCIDERALICCGANACMHHSRQMHRRLKREHGS